MAEPGNLAPTSSRRQPVKAPETTGPLLGTIELSHGLSAELYGRPNPFDWIAKR